MVAVYFIEVAGEKAYKADTFWSKTKRLDYAKLHDDSEYDQERFFESFVRSVGYFSEDVIMGLDGALYGMDIIQIVDGDIKILETVYLRIIKVVGIEPIGDSNLKKFNVEIESVDYKSYNRDRIIGGILDKE